MCLMLKFLNFFLDSLVRIAYIIANLEIEN